MIIMYSENLRHGASNFNQIHPELEPYGNSPAQYSYKNHAMAKWSLAASVWITCTCVLGTGYIHI